MSRPSGIIIRIHADEDGANEGFVPFEIETVARDRDTFAGDRYARNRLISIGRVVVLAMLGIAAVSFIAYRTDRAPSSIRIPLIPSSTSFAPLGGLADSLSDLFDQSDDGAPSASLPAPPEQDLQGMLPDTIGNASPLPSALQSDLLTFDPRLGEAATDGVEGAANELAPAALAPPPKALTTVKRGTFIPAILETPIEPGTPSGVRAIVPSDVAARGPGGMMVPKSSRLVGQYYSKESGGRQRVYIIWKQLILPNGKAGTIASGSIAKDKFFDSFGTASMISILEAEGQTGALDRVRTGEPLRVITARDVEVSGAARQTK